jgi:hypothetical protein
MKEQAFFHRTTNHLFDEGKKDVAGKSNDSCTQAEVDREGRGYRGRTGKPSIGAHIANAGAGAERVV